MTMRAYQEMYLSNAQAVLGDALIMPSMFAITLEKIL